MKKIGIMTDSHSGILTEEAEKLGIKVLPMPFYIDDELYLEGVDLSREEFYEKLRQGVNVSTSQPSPQEVMETWDDMLKEYETLIYIPISSGLSGSCMTAQGLAQDEEYEGKVFVVDNGHVSTPLHRSVLAAVEWQSMQKQRSQMLQRKKQSIKKESRAVVIKRKNVRRRNTRI